MMSPSYPGACRAVISVDSIASNFEVQIAGLCGTGHVLHVKCGQQAMQVLHPICISWAASQRWWEEVAGRDCRLV